MIAAYAVGIGAVVAYAAWLDRERRRLLALEAADRQKPVDKEPAREV
ncbi:MAG: hypothetical protein R3263_12945 [Myxococcota bacterium]|nr:hypothetical protein [Myxococcota bacterium]